MQVNAINRHLGSWQTRLWLRISSDTSSYPQFPLGGQKCYVDQTRLRGAAFVQPLDL
jgi:hypothetical protein